MFFNDIIGQPAAVNTFRQVLESNRLSHAYILTGPSGTGKFRFAKTLAKVLMCETKNTDWTQKGNDSCRACKWIDKNCHPNLRITEVEKGSKEIKIEAVREIEKELMLMPFSRTHRVFIVNQAERMSEEAFNAFLKTLEEPVKDTVIILVASNLASLPQTVISRCQVIRFYPIEQSLVIKYLEEHLKIKRDDALLLSHLADGSIGDACKLQAQGLLEQREHLITGLARDDSERLTKDIINYARKNSEDNEGLRLEIIWQLKIIGLFVRDALWLHHGLPDNKLLNKDRISETKQYQRRYNYKQTERLLERLLKSERYIRLNANYSLVVESLFVPAGVA
ncbi:MAG: DNA polymerase III subunit delta' [Planctomycetes bacterium]|nr:DNA polymerase III subunit delta' [Planctomycetota bacterium]